jgi:hypothetical protein
MSTTHTRDSNYAPPSSLGRFRQRWLIVGGIAAIISIIGAFVSPDQFLRGYLMGYMWTLGLALGSLALLMTGHLSGGNWWMLNRRTFEAAVGTLPVWAILFLPILLGMKRLYLWTHADLVHGDHVLMSKAAYLNTPFWIVRAVIYFVLWIGLAWFLRTWSAKQDTDAAPAIWQRMKSVAAPGILIYGLTITFASVDWVMSLDPHWFSTIYGMLFMAGQGLSALAFAICILVLLSPFSPMREIVREDRLHDLGKLMLAFTMVWAYFSFSQWLIIWMANLPEEISWYLHRIKNGWQAVALLLIVLQFALPFLLLLSRSLKRDARKLVPVALLIIVMRLVDLYWLVAPNALPSANAPPFTLHWTYVAVPLALMGLWLALFSWNLSKRPLLVATDPQLPRLWERSHGH